MSCATTSYQTSNGANEQIHVPLYILFNINVTTSQFIEYRDPKQTGKQVLATVNTLKQHAQRFLLDVMVITWGLWPRDMYSRIRLVKASTNHRNFNRLGGLRNAVECPQSQHPHGIFVDDE